MGRAKSTWTSAFGSVSLGSVPRNFFVINGFKFLHFGCSRRMIGLLLLSLDVFLGTEPGGRVAAFLFGQGASDGDSLSQIALMMLEPWAYHHKGRIPREWWRGPFLMSKSRDLSSLAFPNPAL